MNYCYLLYTESGNTYVGATKNVNKRLRQHNKEIVGGARATGIQVERGFLWKRACYISNIPEWRSALQIEWKWKQLGRTQFRGIRNPIEHRLYSLKALLSLERPTSKSIPYDAYPDGPPTIVWESDELQEKYEQISIPHPL